MLAVLRAVKATYADDGPGKCSGMPMMRYNADARHSQFGAPFTLLQHEREEHHPIGTVQIFTYCLYRKELNTGRWTSSRWIDAVLGDEDLPQHQQVSGDEREHREHKKRSDWAVELDLDFIAEEQ